MSFQIPQCYFDSAVSCIVYYIQHLKMAFLHSIFEPNACQGHLPSVFCCNVFLKSPNFVAFSRLVSFLWACKFRSTITTMASFHSSPIFLGEQLPSLYRLCALWKLVKPVLSLCSQFPLKPGHGTRFLSRSWEVDTGPERFSGEQGHPFLIPATQHPHGRTCSEEKGCFWSCCLKVLESLLNIGRVPTVPFSKTKMWGRSSQDGGIEITTKIQTNHLSEPP